MRRLGQPGTGGPPCRPVQRRRARDGKSCTPPCKLLLALAAVGVFAAIGCGPRYAPPVAGADEVEAARLSIAAAPPPLHIERSAEESAALLDGVARRIAAAAQPVCAAHLGRTCAFSVSLEPSDVPRAEATGRGQVRVTAGMLRLIESEDELAALLGHEVGHHLAGHLDRQFARGMAAGTAAGMALGALLPFGGLAAWALGQGAAELGAGAARLAFSKEEEREADYLGAYLVARAGYDLERAGRLWARLARRGMRETTGLLDSHPATPDRLAAWQRTAEEIRASSSPDLMPRRTSP